ncbi:uncharacterized protein EV420DRAFT_1272442 [Desarmillaria tabescens]|uniref:Uncharacterized protein n=1 Tax=Armillaria tabescens TaxID=1929756 RepID=A0AA39N2T9_ARMTA|nr:uncharacterized protein EV420DRAFT_1272442 [Desarmillaria tabescens]KAK0455418.1 hypothetical protein EV420DRAFT_1272442 [Desarmillaria tabescens]
MPPAKSHRVHSTSNLRSHSRSSSSTKLAGNLQVTQKDFVQPKGLEKTKKISHEHARTTLPLPRTSSAVRVEAREREHQTVPPSKRQPPPATTTTSKANGSKLKGGFTISADSEDDDDAWVSSEADTSTESVNLTRESDPDSDTENASTPNQALRHVIAPAIAAQDQDPAELAALLSKPSSPNVTESRLYTRPGKSPSKSTVRAVSEQVQGQIDNSSDNRRHSSAIVPSESASGATSPRSKHHSRPSSVYSVSSKHLRPHPLIRGQSHGPSGIQPKRAPLAPLTVTSDPTSQLSTSVPNDSSLSNLTDRHVPTSPVASLTAPPSPNAPLATQSPFRRSSVSSARSVSTLPVTTSVKEARIKPDRHRTLSTISSSSSIAALSSLVHLPVTTSHRISLFPPIDEDVGKIHSLLPPPYAENHLQFLAHRSPLRASYDRVMRAKAAATAGR